MSRQSSIIYETCLRFDTLKAIGVSRHHEKRRLRDEAARQGTALSPIGLSTGRIHADKTLDTYKGIALRYVHWARRMHGVARLADLDAAADRLVTLYLDERIAAGDSPSTLKTIRSALRMFHGAPYAPGDRAAAVLKLGDQALPARTREGIVRSRGHAAMDDALALDRYGPLVGFCRATGLRRRELAACVVGDVQASPGGDLAVAVHNGKGGKSRVVPVLPWRTGDVLGLIVGRSPEETVIPRVPVRLDVHHYRRLYAQDLYTEGGLRALPAPEGRLAPGSVDTARALVVAGALGHNRLDVVLRHYLR